MFGPPVEYNRKKSIYADFALLFCALVWGFQYSVTKGALSYVSPFFLNALRYGGAFAVLALLFPGRILRFTLKDLVPGIFMGTTLFLAFSFHTAGLKYTLGGKAAFLTSVYVILVPFILWALQKRFPGIDSLLGSLICILGTALLTGLGVSGLSRGDLLVLVSAFFFAGNIIAIRSVFLL